MGGFQQRKLKTPTSPSRGGMSVFERDKVLELSDARNTYVRNTGGELRDVKTSKAYKNLSASEKKRYRKLNPFDFMNEQEEEATVSKKTLLGGK